MDKSSTNAQVESADSDATEQTEPTTGSEQTSTEVNQKSYADELLELAKGDAPTEHVEAIAELPTEPEPEPEPQSLDGETEPEPEPVAAEAKEHKGDVWPDSAKQRVAEETAKRKRANERAEKAETLAAQLQEQFARLNAPQPTKADPFNDVQTVQDLERLKVSYDEAVDVLDKAIDLAEEQGQADIIVGVKDGRPETATLTREQLKEKKRETERSLRTFIPERERYLTLRAQESARAVELYSELKDPESDFAKQASALAESILTGRAQRSPDILVWIARAVRGYQAELEGSKSNGALPNGDAKKIIESSKQKIAPTPTRTRSLPERKSTSSDLAKVETEFVRKRDENSAEAYVGALLSQKGSGHSRKLVSASE